MTNNLASVRSYITKVAINNQMVSCSIYEDAGIEQPGSYQRVVGTKILNQK